MNSFINNQKNIYAKNKKQSNTGIFVKIDSLENKNLINSMEKILLKYKGNEDVYVCTVNPKRMFKWNNVKVNLQSSLQNELEDLLGKGNIKIKI